MALSGLRQAGRQGALFEYPVWMWARWPWVQRAPGQGGVRELLSQLRWRVDVRSAIATKKQALACHETQTRRLSGDSEWPVLSDVAGGDFLDCFFSGSEYFQRSVLGD